MKEESARPLPIIPYWERGTFEDSLDMPLDYPYSSTEWDGIFSTFIDLLDHEDRWVRKAAINRLKIAFKSENSQVSNSDEYSPKSIAERIREIFEAITLRVASTPDIFEDFYHQFRFIVREKPYRSLMRRWLDQLVESKERQNPSDELVLAARILLEQDLHWSLQPSSNNFETTIAHIDGYLHGLSELCHGVNYVPLYRAMTCSQVTSEISTDVQATILFVSSEFGVSMSRLKQSCECRDFQRVDEWETELDESIVRWILNRMFEGRIQSSQNLPSAQSSVTYHLIWLIREAMEPDEPEVWRFQIAHGCDYIWGFHNESYAFKARDKSFILTFGWAD